MIPSKFFTALFLLAAFTSLKAVESVVSGNPTYNTNNNISNSVTGWSTGWGAGNTNTGWNYVGSLNGASGVYLGNGWVLTASHVGPGNFTLGGNTFDYTGTSYQTFTNALTGTSNADLTLFQISTLSTTGTNIPLSYNLTITPSAPALTSTLVILGYGYTNGVGPESWGKSSVLGTNLYPINVNNQYSSIDFYSASYGSSYTKVVLGDSGGADFIKVGSSWELAGINEVILTDTNSNEYSGFVQLSSYASQISTIVSTVPEPSTYCLMIFGVGAMGFTIWRSRRRS